MSEMVYMYGFGFGGPPGRNVTVHVTYGGATGSGANVSCTNGKKTFYGVTDAYGIFTVKLAKGKWTITADKSGSTSTVHVDITGDCTVNVSLFAATINITYPKGYSCTAKNGTTTLTAPGTSGTWKCVVPNAGTWTVKFFTGSTEFYSKSIKISQNGGSVNVAPVFLYYYGNECTGITGGWTFGTNTWEESNRFKMQQKSGDYASRVTSNNSVNLSGKTLYVDVKDDSVSSSRSCFNLYVNGGYFSLTSIPASGRNVMQIDTTNSNKGTIALEYAGRVRDYTSICYVYRMWLE